MVPSVPYARYMLRRYAFSWCYLGLFVIAEIVYANVGAHGQDVLATWTSTNVVNLEHDPVGTLIASAIFGQGNVLAWPVLIVLAVLPANHALGNIRTALICLAGNVIGSLVSEGIIAYRVDTGQLPVSYRHLIDIGPSYVVVAATVVALICGGWVARISAGFVLGVLVFIGDIFAGLSTFDVAAVGHLTSAVTALACAIPILYRRHSPAAQPGHAPHPGHAPPQNHASHPDHAAHRGPSGHPDAARSADLIPTWPLILELMCWFTATCRNTPCFSGLIRHVAVTHHVVRRCEPAPSPAGANCPEMSLDAPSRTALRVAGAIACIWRRGRASQPARGLGHVAYG